MRFAAVDGRASLVRGDAVFDVAECSDGAIPADPMLVLRDHWDDLAALAPAGEGRPPGLAAGDVIRTQIAGVGIMENRCRNDSQRPHQAKTP